MAEIVVSTFEEFVTACATSGAEVVCPEEAVWDMNQIAPAGAPTVTVACAKIIGNGTTIAKASIISRSLFNFTAADATVSRLNISDFTADTSVITGTVNGMIWKQSEFSGVQNAGAMVARSMTFCEDESSETPLGCGFRVHLGGGTFFQQSMGNSLYLNNCKARFTGGGKLDPVSGSYPNYMQLRYCFFEGDFTQISLNYYCEMSIINSPSKRGVYAGAQWAPCTEEQLQNVEYLRSIGFYVGSAT